MTKVTWLHLSDLHVGDKDQSFLWPRFNTLFLQDLERLHERAGPWDLVVFSGDLTQKGSKDDFKRLNDILDRVWTKFDELGCKPTLIAAPGNHDLARPAADDLRHVALRQFWNDETVREKFWAESDRDLRPFLLEVFSNYTEWQQSQIASGRHATPIATGLIPGDASYTVEKNDTSIGVITLNSTWLQLGAGNYEERLCVDARQLLAVAPNPDEWLALHSANLLVTHHPDDWLHPSSLDGWNNDINPPERFDVHLFGHMHLPQISSVSYGGSASRRASQAASLFGLERLADGTTERVQGYSANALSLTEGKRVYDVWPRRLVDVTGGHKKLAADQSQGLLEDNRLSIEYRGRMPTGRPPLTAGTTTSDSPPIFLEKFDLQMVRYHIPDMPSHRNIRRVEQQRCKDAFNDKRIIWLTADWGMGEDGFISALRNTFLISNANIFKFDLERYKSRIEFLSFIKQNFGVGFEQICESISNAGASFILLDEIPVSTVTPQGSISIESDVEALAEVVKDYAPDAYIFLRARRAPAHPTVTHVSLKALDEADTVIYLGDSSDGSERYARPDALAAMYRHTDGVPSRLDAAIKELEFTSLSDLVSSNPDFGDTGAALSDTPDALVAAVSELKNGAETGLNRAHDLLLALSALPRGEQLSRIKRFYGPHPLHQSHARELHDRSLIEVFALSGMGETDDASLGKALIVPRPVRDYVREQLGEQEARSLDAKALSLYFGDNWHNGEIFGSPSGRRCRSPLCDGYEIVNSGTLIVRNLRRALDDENELEIEAAIRLSSSFISCLIEGDHYRSAAALCDDVIPLIGADDHRDKINVLRLQKARSLRMLDSDEDARDAFLEVDLDILSKSQKQSALVGLAYCYEHMKETELAATTANRIIALGKTSYAALQARVILAEQIEDTFERRTALKRLLQEARKKKHDVTANNISLTLSAELKMDNPNESNELLRDVSMNARKSGDFYNGARAIIQSIRRRDRLHPVNSQEKSRLIAAYHYLHNERLLDLFNSCHETLWDIFEEENDTNNILSLFRHSSFIWRINGRHQEEIRYVSRLAKSLHNYLNRDVRDIGRDQAYFVVRVAVVLRDAELLAAK